MPSSFTNSLLDCNIHQSELRINGTMNEIALLAWCLGSTTSKHGTVCKTSTTTETLPFSFLKFHNSSLMVTWSSHGAECLPGASSSVRPPSSPSLHSFIQRLIINLTFIYGRPLILSEWNKPSLTPKAPLRQCSAASAWYELTKHMDLNVLICYSVRFSTYVTLLTEGINKQRILQYHSLFTSKCNVFIFQEVCCFLIRK